MSAIFGVYHWDGNAAQSDDLAVMGNALQRDGGSPPKTWMERSVGLGNILLASTLEASVEALPRWQMEAGLCITADVRLDNREILIDVLGVEAKRPGIIPDSELILRAYQKWGESCTEWLVGDFAFAIWDEGKQTLFCARDHFGVRPFYYYPGAGSFTFASDFAALLKLSEVPTDINRRRIADFLVGIAEDSEDTYYASIRKLRPAHTMSIERGGAVRTARYHRLTSENELRLKNDEAYAQAFRELFIQAVRRRTRTPGPTACMLSGGLDSSAITCVAGQLHRQNACGPVSTFSNTYPNFPECDESIYIRSVLDQGGYDSHVVPVDAVRSMSDLEKTIERIGEPTYALGLFGSGDLYGVVRAAGMNAVLDGHGGDEVVSDGQALLRELAEKSRWLELAIESWLLAKVNRVSFLPGFLRMVITYGVVGKVRRGLRLRTLLRLGKPSQPVIAEESMPKWAAHLHPDFFVETRIRERRKEWRAGQSDTVNETRAAHWRKLANSGQSNYFEQLNRVAAANGVEPRYPFWDKDLVEFCLRLPTRQKVRRGWIKDVLRRGLRGILPDRIRMRRDKMDFSAQSQTALRSLGEDNLRALFAESEVGKTLISSVWYSEAVTHLFQKDTSKPMEMSHLWWCISVLTWLKIASKKS